MYSPSALWTYKNLLQILCVPNVSQVGHHHYSSCPIKKTDTPTCVNCGETHIANYRDYKFVQDLKERVVNKKGNSINNSVVLNVSHVNDENVQSTTEIG